MSVDCSIDSLDVPLKRPMFESTVIGEVATRLQMEPLPPHCRDGIPSHDDMDRRQRQLPPQVHGEGVDSTELRPQLQHVVMDTTELEHRSQSHHDNEWSDRGSSMPELLQQVETQPQLQHCRDNSTTLLLCPQLHQGNTDTPATKHCPQVLACADKSSVCDDTGRDTIPCEAKQSSTDSSDASELRDSDDFFERESHTPSFKVLSQVEAGSEDIVPCQRISHALSSSRIPQQSSVRESHIVSKEHAETSRDEQCLENCPRISTGRCIRKVSKLSENSFSSIVSTDSQLRSTGCTSSIEVSPLHNVALGAVFKSRVDPHTRCFQEIPPNLPSLHVTESPAPQQKKNGKAVSTGTHTHIHSTRPSLKGKICWLPVGW